MVLNIIYARRVLRCRLYVHTDCRRQQTMILNRETLNKDGLELEKIMHDPELQVTKIKTFTVILFHVLCRIERRVK